MKEQKKLYHENNKEKVKEQKKLYHENNRDKILEKHKKYYENNKKQLIEYSITYRLNNRDKLKEKITCECGCDVVKRNISRHMKSKKHIDLMNTIKE